MDQLYVVVRREYGFEHLYEVDESTAFVGRQSDCPLRLPDRSVSRKHALIFKQGPDFCLRDLGSRNGTILNGRRMTSDERLCTGDEAIIGPFRLSMWDDKSVAIREVIGGEGSTRPDHVAHSLSENSGVVPRLTKAQGRVYALLMEGLIEKEAAARLGISINTIHEHVKAIYKAYRVSTRGELMARSRFDPTGIVRDEQT